MANQPWQWLEEECRKRMLEVWVASSTDTVQRHRRWTCGADKCQSVGPWTTKSKTAFSALFCSSVSEGRPERLPEIRGCCDLIARLTRAKLS